LPANLPGIELNYIALRGDIGRPFRTLDTDDLQKELDSLARRLATASDIGTIASVLSEGSRRLLPATISSCIYELNEESSEGTGRLFCDSPHAGCEETPRNSVVDLVREALRISEPVMSHSVESGADDTRLEEGHILCAFPMTSTGSSEAAAVLLLREGGLDSARLGNFSLLCRLAGVKLISLNRAKVIERSIRKGELVTHFIDRSRTLQVNEIANELCRGVASIFEDMSSVFLLENTGHTFLVLGSLERGERSGNELSGVAELERMMSSRKLIRKRRSGEDVFWSRMSRNLGAGDNEKTLLAIRDSTSRYMLIAFSRLSNADFAQRLQCFEESLSVFSETAARRREEEENSVLQSAIAVMFAALKSPDAIYREEEGIRIFTDLLCSLTGAKKCVVACMRKYEGRIRQIASRNMNPDAPAIPWQELVCLLPSRYQPSSVVLPEGHEIIGRTGFSNKERPALYSNGGRAEVQVFVLMDSEGKKETRPQMLQAMDALSGYLERVNTAGSGKNAHAHSALLELLKYTLISGNSESQLSFKTIITRICSLTASVLDAEMTAYVRGEEDGNYHCLSVWPENDERADRIIQQIMSKMKCSSEQAAAYRIVRDADFSAMEGGKQCVLLSIRGNAANTDHVVAIMRTEGLSIEEKMLLSEMSDILSSVVGFMFENMNRSKTMNAVSSQLDIARSLNSTLDLKSILNDTLKEVANFTRSHAVVGGIIDEKGRFGTVAIEGIGQERSELIIDAQERDLEISPREVRAFASLASEIGSHFHLKDRRACSEFLAEIPQNLRILLERTASGKAIESILGVPLSFAGRLLGLIICIQVDSKSHFDNQDIKYAESVAPLLSTAVENAMNFAATYDALSKLKRVDTLRANFSSIAAHELRTPLTSIRVYVELMKAGKVGKFNEAEIKNIDNLVASISELNDIIDNMLEYTRMEAILLETELTELNPGPLLEEICATFSAQFAAKSINFSYAAEGALPSVRASESLLKRVINNIIGNAIKFTPEGGRIEVKVSPEADGVLISVSDTGKGIPEDELPFIFDRFHIVDSSLLHSRTGFRLGLPISKVIVERHGGKIWADSELGKGSTFYVLLPAKGYVSKDSWLSDVGQLLQ